MVVQLPDVAVNVSLFVPFAKVIVALVRVCVVPLFVQVEQSHVAFSSAVKVIEAVSPELTCPLPLARVMAVGAVCTGVEKMKTALVFRSESLVRNMSWRSRGRLTGGGGCPRVTRSVASPHRGLRVPK